MCLTTISVADWGHDHLMLDQLHYRFFVRQVLRWRSTAAPSRCVCQRWWSFRFLQYFSACQGVHCSTKRPNATPVVCQVTPLSDSSFPSGAGNGTSQPSSHWGFPGWLRTGPGSLHLSIRDLLCAASGRSGTLHAWSSSSCQASQVYCPFRLNFACLFHRYMYCSTALGSINEILSVSQF